MGAAFAVGFVIRPLCISVRVVWHGSCIRLVCLVDVDVGRDSLMCVICVRRIVSGVELGLSLYYASGLCMCNCVN